MKCRFLTALLIIIILMGTFSVNADDNNTEEASPEWMEMYSVDFEDFLEDGEFNYVYDIYDMNISNIKTKNGNTYFNSQWPKGSVIKSKDPLSKYMIEFEMQTNALNSNNNGYKAGLALQIIEGEQAFVMEPDNSDEDPTSYLGTSGVYLFFYNKTLEVVIHSNKDGGTAGPVNGGGKTTVVKSSADRWFGVYGVSYLFTLPSGINFTNNFVDVRVEVCENIIEVYMQDNIHICSIELSNIQDTVTYCNEKYWQEAWRGSELVDGSCYNTAIVKNAEGEVVLTVDNAVVPVEGLFAFTHRCSGFNIDNIVLYEEYVEATPTPETKPSPTPSATDAPETDSEAETNNNTAGISGDDIIISILIAAIVLVGITIAFVLVAGKKRVC